MEPIVRMTETAVKERFVRIAEMCKAEQTDSFHPYHVQTSRR